jgi:hypothetical protein
MAGAIRVKKSHARSGIAQAHHRETISKLMASRDRSRSRTRVRLTTVVFVPLGVFNCCAFKHAMKRKQNYSMVANEVRFICRVVAARATVIKIWKEAGARVQIAQLWKAIL